MTPELDKEYRQLALEIVDTFGQPLFDMFLKTLGSDVRLLDTAANGIWLGMRKQVMKFPPQLIQELKQYKGTNRIAKFLLRISPAFIMTAPIENIEKVMEELYPILDRLDGIRKRGELDAKKTSNS